MSKTFAIPIEKCISIKENAFNNNQYTTVSISKKDYTNVNTRELVVENELLSIYNVTPKSNDVRTPLVANNTNKCNAFNISKKYLKKVTYNGQTRFIETDVDDTYDYMQEYLTFYGETSFFDFDDSITFTLKAKSSITQVMSPRHNTADAQTDELSRYGYDNTEKDNNLNNYINDYVLIAVSNSAEVSPGFIPYFQKSYDYVTIDGQQVRLFSNITETNVTNGKEHELFILYYVNYISRTIKYCVYMLTQETERYRTLGRTDIIYRISVDYHFYIHNVFTQNEDIIYKNGTGTIADCELSTNNLISNYSNISFIDPNNNNATLNIDGATYGTYMTKKFYENGRPTVEITLPIMPLEDLDGNIVVLGTGANAQNIVVGDTFKITKNGTWDNLKMYQVTTVETCFNGAYRWVIKAKETYELIDIRYFVPQLKVGRHKENQTPTPHFELANVEDFEKIMTKTGLEKNDFQVGIIIKRNHCLKSDRRDYGGGVYSRSHTTTFQKIHLNNGSDNEIKTNYILEFGTNYRIKGLFEIIYDSYLKPTNKKYYLKPERGIYKTYRTGEKMYNLIGVCFKQSSDYISKKSKQFLVIERTIASPTQNDILSSSKTLYEKFNNLTW